MFDTIAMAREFHDQATQVDFEWVREGNVVYHFIIMADITQEMFYEGSPLNPPLALKFFRNTDLGNLIYRMELSPYRYARDVNQVGLAITPTDYEYDTERQENSVFMMLAQFYVGLHDTIGPFSKIFRLTRIRANRMTVDYEMNFIRERIVREYEITRDLVNRED